MEAATEAGIEASEAGREVGSGALASAEREAGGLEALELAGVAGAGSVRVLEVERLTWWRCWTSGVVSELWRWER